MRYLYILLFFISVDMSAQKINPLTKIMCNHNQRVYLIFSSKITVIDISSKEVTFDRLDDKTMYVILSTPYFEENKIINGIVICEDKSHYPIEIRKGPDYLTNTTIAFFTENGDNSLKTYNNINVTASILHKKDSVCNYVCACKKVLNLKRNLYDFGIVKQGIITEIENIAVDDSFVYIKVLYSNESKINYNVDFNGLVLKSSSGIKKIAGSDELLNPVYIDNAIDVIPSKSKNLRSIIVYSLFTLKDNQSIVYFLKEKNGGREIYLKLNSEALFKRSINIKNEK